MATSQRILIVLGVVVGVFLLGLIVYALLVFTSVKRFANYWSGLAQQPADDSALVIVALGDSTVQGIGATSPMKSFVGQLAKKIAASDGRPVQIYNFSKTGAKASDVLSQQLGNKDVIERADIILIAVGPNDMIKGVSREAYLKQYQQILSKLPNDKTVIATIPPLLPIRVGGQLVSDWNRDLEKLAAGKKVRTAPVYDAIEPRQYNPLIYSADFFHPSNYGYGFWANAFYDPVLEVLSFQG